VKTTEPPIDSLLEPSQAFKEAVRKIGSQVKAATLLGVSQAAISKRIVNRQPAAAEWVLPLERETGVSRQALRPDLYPHESPSTVRDIPLTGRIGSGNPISGLQLGEPAR